MRKLMVVLMASVLFAAMPTLAGPLVIEQVSDGANWVAHTDYQQFNNSWTGQLIRKELVNLGIEEKLTNFATVFSFHPLDDVRDVTIYGTGKDREKAIVLIEGVFDKERILALVRMNPQHKEITYGDIVLHEWFDENQQGSNDSAGQMMYGCFYQDDLIVMGAGLEGVKQAIDVLNGSAPNAASGVFNQAALDAKGAFFQVAGKRVGEMVGQDPQAAVLRQTDQLGLAIGEVEGKFYIDLGLTARSEEAAQAITKMLDGIIAFASLPNEEQPMLAELAKKVKVSCEKNTVQVHFESDPEAVVQFLKDQWQRKIEKGTQTQ